MWDFNLSGIIYWFWQKRKKNQNTDATSIKIVKQERTSLNMNGLLIKSQWFNVRLGNLGQHKRNELFTA